MALPVLALVLLPLMGHAAPLTQELVVARATILYAERLASLRIDADPQFTQRVRGIALPLIAQARRDYPETAQWDWQVHTRWATSACSTCRACWPAPGARRTWPTSAPT
jgi:hypothetical protein